MKQSLQSDRLNALFAPWEGQALAAIVKDLISFKPTRHVVNTASGVRFFTYCAVDTLLIAHLLDEDVDIATTPPEQSQPVRITVRGKQLHVSRSAVIAIPVQYKDQAILETFCPYANIFPDEGAYSRWAASVPVATISAPIGDAFDITLAISNRLKGLAAVEKRPARRCCP